jgi:hypothetical protein
LSRVKIFSLISVAKSITKSAIAIIGSSTIVSVQWPAVTFGLGFQGQLTPGQIAINYYLPWILGGSLFAILICDHLFRTTDGLARIPYAVTFLSSLTAFFFFANAIILSGNLQPALSAAFDVAIVAVAMKFVLNLVLDKELYDSVD